jgi:hypothetical protein
MSLIDGARSAMLNNVFSGSFDNVLLDVPQVLAEHLSSEVQNILSSSSAHC